MSLQPFDLRDQASADVSTSPGRAAVPRGPRAARPRITWVLDGPGWLWARPIADLLTLSAAALWTVNWPGAEQPAFSDAWSLALLPPIAMALLLARGMYRKRMRPFVLDGIAPVVGAISIAVMAVVLLGSYVGGGQLSSSTLLRLWLLALALTGGARIALMMLQRQARAQGLIGRATLIVGAGSVGARVARRLEEQPEYGLRPVGFLDADPPPRHVRRPRGAGARRARRPRARSPA